VKLPPSENVGERVTWAAAVFIQVFLYLSYHSTARQGGGW